MRNVSIWGETRLQDSAKNFSPWKLWGLLNWDFVSALENDRNPLCKLCADVGLGITHNPHSSLFACRISFADHIQFSNCTLFLFQLQKWRQLRPNPNAPWLVEGDPARERSLFLALLCPHRGDRGTGERGQQGAQHTQSCRCTPSLCDECPSLLPQGWIPTCAHRIGQRPSRIVTTLCPHLNSTLWHVPLTFSCARVAACAAQ